MRTAHAIVWGIAAGVLLLVTVCGMVRCAQIGRRVAVDWPRVG